MLDFSKQLDDMSFMQDGKEFVTLADAKRVLAGVTAASAPTTSTCQSCKQPVQQCARCYAATTAKDAGKVVLKKAFDWLSSD